LHRLRSVGMSLRPDDSHRRGRSKSPGRERSRSRAEERRETSTSRLVIERPVEAPRRYVGEEDDRIAYREYEQRMSVRAADGREEYRAYGSSRKYEDDDLAYGDIPGTKRDKEDKYRRKEYREERSERPGYEREDSWKYGSDSRESRLEREELQRRHDSQDHGRSLSLNLAAGVNLGHGPPSPRIEYGNPAPQGYGDSHGHRYDDPKKFEYSTVEDSLRYTTRPPPQHSLSYEQESTSHSRNPSTSYHSDKHSTQVVTVEPRHHSLPVNSLGTRMSSLSVSGLAPSYNLASAPPSPLQEAYHGTYQSISPMPSPLLLATHSSSSIGTMEPLSPRVSAGRHARFHDPSSDASAISKALDSSRKYPDTAPLIQILPALTHNQIMNLRAEYKNLVKTTTSSGVTGVNVAKHIKMRLKESPPNLLKACYVCALGQWESEAHWANFWYHGEKSNRELLIESLFGRPNWEIREINDGFKDKKYSDSLIKCMKTELREDKFKKAVLMVLDERREDGRVDMNEVEKDVRILGKAITGKGGETAMISIIVVRSDDHLREVLRVYEVTYRKNFARELLKKSGNLVVRPPVHHALDISN
jgi:hypothetical protein